MACLAFPTTDVRRSFLAAMAEFIAEGRGVDEDDTMVGDEIRDFCGSWHTSHGFAAYADALRADSLPKTARPAGYVPCTTWWWVEGREYSVASQYSSPARGGPSGWRSSISRRVWCRWRVLDSNQRRRNRRFYRTPSLAR